MLTLSIIIPCFNAQKTLAFLLDSLQEQLEPGDEWIVVDDGSTDATSAVAKTFSATLLTTGGRKGPAAARNLGAKNAKGDLLLFLDADVIAPKHLLARIRLRFGSEPALSALSGVYDAEPANEGFFRQLKAVQCAVWFEGVHAYESLETACAVVRKKAFEQTGGFDETYSGADVEDYEFGYRLGTPIEIDHALRVRHHFPDFCTNTKNYFQRARQWAGLFRKRRTFDSGSATSKQAAAVTLLPFASLFFLLSWIAAGCSLAGLLAAVSLVLWGAFKWPVVRELAFYRHSPRTVIAYLYLYAGDLAAAVGGIVGFLQPVRQRLM